MVLSAEEARRYARHITLKGIGGPGQQKLKAARVAVVGAGGLGSPVVAYLAGAGVGHLRVIDPDVVSLSNLQRQVIHREADIGKVKVESAERFARDLNPLVTFEPRSEELDGANAEKLLQGCDLVLDGTDNLSTRRAVADAAERLRTTLVSGAVSMFDGQVTVFAPHLDAVNPRYADLYPEGADEADLPTCEQVGVLGPLTGVIGALMAMEAIKIITGHGAPLIGRLMLYDGSDGRFSELRYARGG